MNKLSPKERLETALTVIKNPALRLKIRRFYETEIKDASIFWDDDEKEVELMTDEYLVSFKERKRRFI